MPLDHVSDVPEELSHDPELGDVPDAFGLVAWRISRAWSGAEPLPVPVAVPEPPSAPAADTVAEMASDMVAARNIAVPRFFMGRSIIGCSAPHLLSYVYHSPRYRPR